MLCEFTKIQYIPIIHVPRLIIQYDVNLEYNMTVPKPVPLHCYPIFLTMPGITLDKIKGFCLRKPKVSDNNKNL